MPETTTTTKAAKAPSKKVLATTTGKRSPQAVAKIARMRNKDGMSWAAIGTELNIAPRTVRRIFDEKFGKGAHFESRVEGKGGRVRNAD